jgi:hypothetical protein
MALADYRNEAWTQLATKIPKSLHQRLKVHCAEVGTSLMAFVVDALQEKLVKASRRKRGRARRSAVPSPAVRGRAGRHASDPGPRPT